MPCCWKPAGQLAHGGRVGLGFPGALLRGPVGKEDHRADDFIAPLGLIHEAQLQLRKLRRRFHGSSFRWSASRGAYVPYRAGGCHVCTSAIR